jgi:hypothetical protein
MRIRPKNRPKLDQNRDLSSDERLAGLRNQRFGDAESRYVTRTMAGEHTVRSLRFDKLDLDDRRTGLVDAGHTAARHRFQGEQRHGCGAVACGRGCNVHVFS